MTVDVLESFSVADHDRVRAVARARELQPGDCLLRPGVGGHGGVPRDRRHRRGARAGPAGGRDHRRRHPRRRRRARSSHLPHPGRGASRRSRSGRSTPTTSTGCSSTRPRSPAPSRATWVGGCAPPSSRSPPAQLAFLLDREGHDGRPAGPGRHGRRRDGRAARAPPTCASATASITEIGAGLAPDGETVVDAGGAYVAPGFIDCHTHYDPSVWWDPLVDPMPQHGVTTVVTGNCSLSLTPGARRRPRRAPATCSASSRTSPSTRSPPASRGRGSRTPSGATRCGRTAPR